MRKLLLPLAASAVLLSATAFAQDTKGPATTGPAAQSGSNMTKNDTPSDMTKMAKKSKKMKKAKKM